MNINTLARDLAAIAHQHYVTPDTLDQGVSEALIERMQERLKEPCVTRIGESHGKAFVVYLRDGTKVVVCRDRDTKGAAWLEVQKQAVIGLAKSEPRKAVET